MEKTTENLVTLFVTYPGRRGFCGGVRRRAVRVFEHLLQEKVLGIIAAGNATCLYFGPAAHRVGPSVGLGVWLWRREVAS
jgi:hypothetical protein